MTALTEPQGLALFRRRMLVCAIGVPLAAWLWLLPYSLVLRIVGSTVTERQLARLSRGNILWLDKYRNSGNEKTGIAVHRRPRVVIVGSSHVNQFRGAFFNRVSPEDFYNLSGDTALFIDAAIDLRRLSRASRPDLVLFGVDYNWMRGSGPFDPNLVGQIRATETDWREQLDQWVSILKYRGHGYLDWLRDGFSMYKSAWHDADLWKGFAYALRRRHERLQAYGVSAIVHHAGYRSDGSMQYEPERLATQRLFPLDDSYQAHVERLALGEGDLLYPTGVDTWSLRWLYRYLAYCRDRRIQVIGFAPPISTRLREATVQGMSQRDRIAKLNGILKPLFEACGFVFVDYSDGRLLGGSDEDFYDLHHMTERLAGTLLYHMSTRSEAAPLLAPYLDPERLQHDLLHATSWHLVYG